MAGSAVLASAQTARSRPAPGGPELFLRILAQHEASDVVVVCRANPLVGPKRDLQEVEFFCHSEVLRKTCSVFADAFEFETLSRGGGLFDIPELEDPNLAPKVPRRRRCFELMADDDIVFEVLRYVYCGAVYFHLGFRARFAQFLSVVDFLGIEDMAERLRPSCSAGGSSSSTCPAPSSAAGGRSGTSSCASGSLFAEPGVEQWLRDLQTEDVLGFLQDEAIAAALAHGVGAVGFSVVCNFLSKLIELRPQDLTVDVLGEQLYRRLSDFGAAPASPATAAAATPGGDPSWESLPTGFMGSGPASGGAELDGRRRGSRRGASNAGRAGGSAGRSATMGAIQAASTVRPRLLHLPGPVVFVDLALARGGARCVNLGGLESVLGAAASALAAPGGDAPASGSGSSPDAPPYRYPPNLVAAMLAAGLPMPSSAEAAAAAAAAGVHPALAALGVPVAGDGGGGAGGGGASSSGSRRAAPVQVGRLYHEGTVLKADATRESLLKDGVPPHREVVVFHEGDSGKRLFDITLRRAQARSQAQAERLAVALDGLVAEAALQEPSGGRCRVVEVEYPDPHALIHDLALQRDFDRHAMCILVAGVRTGGQAESAGVGPGWTLGMGVEPQALRPLHTLVLGASAPAQGGGQWAGRQHSPAEQVVVGAPTPGVLGVATAEWPSLSGLWLELRTTVFERITATFHERPFGISWAQALVQEQVFIVIREVKLEGRARAHKVHAAMIIESITLENDDPVKQPAQIMEALRSDRVPATITFCWRQSKRVISAHMLAGVRLEEMDVPISCDDAAEGADVSAAEGGSDPIETSSAAAAASSDGFDRSVADGAACGSSSSTSGVCRKVVVTQVPASHPAGREGIGPGWQVVHLMPNTMLEKPVTSLDQLPKRLVQPTVRVLFRPPPPLHRLLPLDRSREAEGVPPEDWASPGGGAILRSLPWVELSRCDIGPLRRFRLRARTAADGAAPLPFPPPMPPSASTRGRMHVAVPGEEGRSVWMGDDDDDEDDMDFVMGGSTSSSGSSSSRSRGGAPGSPVGFAAAGVGRRADRPSAASPQSFAAWAASDVSGGQRGERLRLHREYMQVLQRARRGEVPGEAGVAAWRAGFGNGATSSAGGGGASGSAGGACSSAGGGSGAGLCADPRAFEVVVLGDLPPCSRAAEQRIRGAGPHDGLAWEMCQALEALAATSPPPSSQWPRIPLVVVAVRRCGAPAAGSASASASASASTASGGRGWLGGLLFGESVAQVLFRLSLHFQRHPPLLAHPDLDAPSGSDSDGSSIEVPGGFLSASGSASFAGSGAGASAGGGASVDDAAAADLGRRLAQARSQLQDYLAHAETSSRGSALLDHGAPSRDDGGGGGGGGGVRRRRGSSGAGSRRGEVSPPSPGDVEMEMAEGGAGAEAFSPSGSFFEMLADSESGGDADGASSSAAAASVPEGGHDSVGGGGGSDVSSRRPRLLR